MIHAAVATKQIIMIFGYIACYLIIGLAILLIIRGVIRNKRRRYEESLNYCDNECDDCNEIDCSDDSNY